MINPSPYYQPLELIAWQRRRSPCPQSSSFMIIEDQPLTGRAEPLLTAMLQAIGYLPDQVDKVTSKAIDSVQPTLMLAFGQQAAQTLLATDEPLDSLRGRLHYLRKNKTPLIVTYHPDHLLAHPADKKKAFSDLQLAHKTLTTSC